MIWSNLDIKRTPPTPQRMDCGHTRDKARREVGRYPSKRPWWLRQDRHQWRWWTLGFEIHRGRVLHLDWKWDVKKRAVCNNTPKFLSWTNECGPIYWQEDAGKEVGYEEKSRHYFWYTYQISKWRCLKSIHLKKEKVRAEDTYVSVTNVYIVFKY